MRDAACFNRLLAQDVTSRRAGGELSSIFILLFTTLLCVLTINYESWMELHNLGITWCSLRRWNHYYPAINRHHSYSYLYYSTLASHYGARGAGCPSLPAWTVWVDTLEQLLHARMHAFQNWIRLGYLTYSCCYCYFSVTVYCYPSVLYLPLLMHLWYTPHGIDPGPGIDPLLLHRLRVRLTLFFT